MEKKELSNREERRKKRIRNQIAAYAILIIMIAVLAVGAYHAVMGITQSVRNYNTKVSDAIAEAQTLVEEKEQASTVQTQESESQEVTQAQTEEPGAETNPLDDLIEALLQDMTIEEKVAGLFMVSPEAITGVGTAVQAGDGTRNALAANPVGGLIYAPKNYYSQEQFQTMLQNTRTFSKYPLFLAVNQDVGSDVSYGLTVTPSASEITDTEQTTESYTTLAQSLSTLGIDMTFAPVADVVLGERDAATTAPLVNAAVQALQQAGVSAVIQKFPGEGDGTSITKSLEELRNSEFLAYTNAIASGVDCIMMSNKIAAEAAAEEIPCSLSEVMITHVLRGELGYQGIVMTDYLNGSALSGYTSAEAAVAALQAGADLLLEPASYQEAYAGVLQALADGTLTEERIQESLYRIYRVKYKNALQEAQ